MEIQRLVSVFGAFVAIICLAHTASVTATVGSSDTQYFAVFVEGKKVGHAIQSRKVSAGKVTTSQEMSITVRRTGTSMRMTVRESCTETAAGEPLSFRVTTRLGTVFTRVSGQVDRRGNVKGTTTSLGTKRRITFQWPEGAVMAEGLRLLGLKTGIKAGTQYDVVVFSPEILQAVHTQIQIGPSQSIDLLGRVVDAAQVTTTANIPQVGEIVSTSYVDRDLRVIKAITPVHGIQVQMVACPEKFARGRNDVVELIDKMFLASPEPLDDLGAAQSITYRLTPTGRALRLTIPSSCNQTVQQLENGKISVTVEPVAAPTGVKLPYTDQDKAILESTKPTRFLQSDNAEVISLARRAVGDTEDAAEAARRIEAFVAEHIENRSLSIGFASAAEVAVSKKGDCSEFAVLAAAMCRAVGLPAQVVVGVAYVSDFAGRQGFRAHIWTRVYIGNKWIGLDPAFMATGLAGYGVGHIALAVGDGEPEDFFDLEAALRQFRIEKLVVNRK